MTLSKKNHVAKVSFQVVPERTKPSVERICRIALFLVRAYSYSSLFGEGYMSTASYDPEGTPPECECGAREGEYHKDHCPWEICPFCGVTQGEGCDCIYNHLGLRRRDHDPETSYLAEQTYSGGVSDEQQKEWNVRCADRGRIPFIYAPIVCARCGKLWPDFFSVQDSAWEYYAGPTHRDSVLCERCFFTIKTRTDAYRLRPDWVPNDEAIEAYLKAGREGDHERLRELDPGKFEPYNDRNYDYP